MNFYKDKREKRLSASAELADYLRMKEEENKGSFGKMTVAHRKQARHRWAVEFLRRKGFLDCPDKPLTDGKG